jgi:hypothetical protein
MSGASDYLENKLLDHTLRNTAYTPPAAVYLGLYSGAPTDAGGGTELSGFGYARQAITFGDPAAAGAIANTVQVAFIANGDDWAQATHFGIFDAASGGNLLFWDPLDAPVTVGDGETLVFAPGEIEVNAD